MQALCRLHLLPQALRSRLLRPQPPPAASKEAALEAAVPRGLQAALRKEHNASQVAAIAAAVSSESQLTLIQVCSTSARHSVTLQQGALSSC